LYPRHANVEFRVSPSFKKVVSKVGRRHLNKLADAIQCTKANKRRSAPLGLAKSGLTGVKAKEKSSHSRRGQQVLRWGGFARLATLLLTFAALMLPSTVRAQAPIYQVTPEDSSIRFDVESSVPIKGTFSKWTASMTFKSTDVTTGALAINIEADSVDTGSGMKNGKLKGKDFFDAKRAPQITFASTKVTQTGEDTFDLEGDFTIRGVTKKEHLVLKVSGKGTGSGNITGAMAFDRKEYGMNSNIPFIKIANRVEVNVDLKWKKVSGPPLVFQK
jgi:polyisoprenoid-binding protein YceI